MSLYFESIKLLDGDLHLLDLHSSRINSTIEAVFNKKSTINLTTYLNNKLLPDKGLYKVKIIYGTNIESIDIQPYAIKNHKSIKLLVNDLIQYKYKSCERNVLDNYLKSKAEFDDVIFVKKGLLTDASYSNLIFFDGNDWVTPADCLFEGVKREDLIEKNKIKVKKINIEDLNSFSKIGFINAMRDFEKLYSFVVKEDYLNLIPTT